MTSPVVGALRLARAFGFGLVAFALSVAAHRAGGGQTPSVTTSLVLGFATVWVSVFLTSRRLGVVSSVVSLAVVQVLLHEGLSLASSGGGCMSVVHSHASHLAAGPMTMCSPTMAPQAHLHGTAGLAMTVAHAVSAVLLGVLLARADEAVWFLSALIWPTIPLAPAAAVMVPRVRLAPADWSGRWPQQVVPAGRSLRGPPRGLAPAAV